MLGACRALALTTFLLASACHRAEIGPEHARDYFTENRIELESIVEQVKLCQPDSGKIDHGSNFRCWSSEGTTRNLLDALGAADALWVRANYNERDGEERLLTSIYIAMPSSYGFSFAGVIEAFIYEATAESEAAYERRDDGTAVIERQPVTDAPHHWFWWKIER